MYYKRDGMFDVEDDDALGLCESIAVPWNCSFFAGAKIDKSFDGQV